MTEAVSYRNQSIYLNLVEWFTSVNNLEVKINEGSALRILRVSVSGRRRGLNKTGKY